MGALPTCCRTWIHLLPQDLARLLSLSSAELGTDAVFDGKGNKTVAGGCSELALLQKRVCLKTQRASCLLKKLTLAFYNPALRHIFCDKDSSKAF